MAATDTGWRRVTLRPLGWSDEFEVVPHILHIVLRLKTNPKHRSIFFDLDLSNIASKKKRFKKRILIEIKQIKVFFIFFNLFVVEPVPTPFVGTDSTIKKRHRNTALVGRGTGMARKK